MNKKLVRIIPNKQINCCRYSDLRTHLTNKDGLPLCGKKISEGYHYGYIEGTKPTCQKCRAIGLEILEGEISELIEFWEKEVRRGVKEDSKYSPRLQKMSFSGKLKY